MTTNTLSVKLSDLASASVANAVKEAFDFKINDADVDNSIASYVFSKGQGKLDTNGADGVSAGENLYVESVTINLTYGGGKSISYKINVNRTITITQ